MPDSEPYPGYDKHHDHLMAVVERLNRATWQATAKRGRSLKQRQKRYRPSEEGDEIIEALGRCDENKIKALHLRYL